VSRGARSVRSQDVSHECLHHRRLILLLRADGHAQLAPTTATSRSDSRRPVRYLVNTHWHPDHVAGNGECRAAFPEVAIISTESTRRQIAAQMPDYAKRIARVTPTIDVLKQLVKTGRKADGSAVSADDRTFYETDIEDFQAAMPEVAQVVYAPPTVVLDSEMTVDLGGRTAIVKFLGRHRPWTMASRSKRRRSKSRSMTIERRWRAAIRSS